MRHRLYLDAAIGKIAMGYFSKNQDRINRGGKIVADIYCALLLLAFSIAFFGWLGGVVAFIILEGALLAVDFLVPNDEYNESGVIVR
jgi:hypothetical protein